MLQRHNLFRQDEKKQQHKCPSFSPGCGSSISGMQLSASCCPRAFSLPLPSLLPAGPAVCAIAWWEIREVIWPTPPILFFPRLAFQFTTRTGTSEAAGTRSWDLPFWRQPTHQVGWEQSRNHVINNAGKSLPTDTVIQTKSCLAPATFFHLKNELRWLSSAQQRREISPNISAEKLHSGLRCGSPDFTKATPNNTSRISCHWCFNTDFYSFYYYYYF